jgi:hypothetical protein
VVQVAPNALGDLEALAWRRNVGSADFNREGGARASLFDTRAKHVGNGGERVRQLQ